MQATTVSLHFKRLYASLPIYNSNRYWQSGTHVVQLYWRTPTTTTTSRAPLKCEKRTKEFRTVSTTSMNIQISYFDLVGIRKYWSVPLQSTGTSTVASRVVLQLTTL